MRKREKHCSLRIKKSKIWSSNQIKLVGQLSDSLPFLLVLQLNSRIKMRPLPSYTMSEPT